MKKAFVDKERCKACELCIDVCGKKALAMSESINKSGYKHIEIDESRCIGCGLCYIVCPDGVFMILEQEGN